jgi:integrase
MNRPRTLLDDILDRSNFSPVTHRQYQALIGSWVEFAGQDPRGWTRIAAQNFYEAQLARGVKIKTANQYIDKLRYVSHWFSVQHGGQDFAVVQTRRAPREASTRRALTDDEITALLATCNSALPISKRPIDRRDRTLIVVGLETGMREKSLRSVVLEEIHERGAYPYATVEIKGAGGLAKFDVPLSDTAMLVIHDWARWLRDHGIKHGHLFTQLPLRIDERGRRVFVPTGAPLTNTRIYQIVSDRADAAHIAHVHPHLFRHTFVTTRSLAGMDDPHIASITGHHVNSGLQGAAPTGMRPYFDLKKFGETARQSTPPWFAEHVQRMLEG